jgi:hypothetical protein
VVLVMSVPRVPVLCDRACMPSCACCRCAMRWLHVDVVNALCMGCKWLWYGMCWPAATGWVDSSASTDMMQANCCGTKLFSRPDAPDCLA